MGSITIIHDNNTSYLFYEPMALNSTGMRIGQLGSKLDAHEISLTALKTQTKIAGKLPYRLKACKRLFISSNTIPNVSNTTALVVVIY